MHDLEEAAEKVAEGDLTVVSIAAADEVGRLTSSFGDMVGSLHHMSLESLAAAQETSDGAMGCRHHRGVPGVSGTTDRSDREPGPERLFRVEDGGPRLCPDRRDL